MWAMDYPSMLDVVRLRVHLAEKVLREGGDAQSRADSFVCPECAVAGPGHTHKWTAIAAMDFFDMGT